MTAAAILMQFFLNVWLAPSNASRTDPAYAAWGLNDNQPRADVFTVHDADGSVLLQNQVTVTANVIDPCRVDLHFVRQSFDRVVRRTIDAPLPSLQIDFHHARGIAFAWRPHPFEAALLAVETLSFTPRRYLATRLIGDGAACGDDGTCLASTDTLAFIADSSVTAARMRAAFDRVKTRCP